MSATHLPADFKKRLESIYETKKIDTQLARWDALAGKLQSFTPENKASLRFFSAPGRTELGGNHTDHNLGRVIAGSIDLDTIAVVKERSDLVVRVDAEGYSLFSIDLADLEARATEESTSLALVRGIAAWFVARGLKITGFDTSISSTVLRGSGLSSSASFEVLVASVFNTLANRSVLGPVDLAIAGQWAENNYFGKPCGLMDQVACAHGGVVAIDFAVPGKPVVNAIQADFYAQGYALVIVDAGDDHADLSHEYAAIPGEMKAVAASLGKTTLSQVRLDELEASFDKLRKAHGDRAVLRSLHFLGETERPPRMVEALAKGNFPAYLDLVKESGNSSQVLLQNFHPAGNTTSQAMDLALAASAMILAGKGASRVHGGGFGGTIQAYVPLAMVDSYTTRMERILGKGSVHALSIRNQGVVEL